MLTALGRKLYFYTQYNPLWGSFKEKFGKKIEKSYIVHPKAFSVDSDVIKLPPYMLWCL